MKYTIIYNPVAGGGTDKAALKTVQSQLDQQKIDYDLETTKYAGHGEYLARRLAQQDRSSLQDRVLLVIGGDGTLHEALNGVLKEKDDQGQKLPLAYIPAGSGNDFARGFGISLHPDKALAQVLATEQATTINVGHYHEENRGEDAYFLNNIGIGFDAAIVSRTNASRSKKALNHAKIGRFSYLRNAFGVLYAQQSFRLTVSTADSRDTFPQCFIAIIANHPYIGGGFRIAPTASIHDNGLDLVVAERRGWPRTLWVARLFASGKLEGSRFAKHYHGKHFQYSTNSLAFGQTDGQEMGNRYFNLHVDTAQAVFWQTNQPKK